MHEVLIVDDDPDIRQALVNMLAVAGYGAIAVDDGLEALDYLRTADPPSVILLDLMMPRVDGWHFRAAQLADPRLATLPVVVISAGGFVDEAAQHLGVQDYLAKPLEADRLLDLVAERCRGN